jgi:hypothetical protein
LLFAVIDRGNKMNAFRVGKMLRVAFSVAALVPLSMGMARASAILYAVDSTNQLLTINTSTGVATLADTFTNTSGAPVGIGESGQLLYVLPGYAGGTGNATQLISLDPNNSYSQTTTSLGLAVGGVSALSQGDIAFDSNGNLTIASATQKSGVFSATNGAIYSADLGAHTTTTEQASLAPKFDGIAYNGTGQLFGLSREVSNGSGGFIDSLYSFNSSFVPTLVGATGITDSSANTFAGLAFAQDGTLYAILGNTTSSRLFTINPATGTATLVANIMLGGSGIGAIDGAAFLPTSSASTPEPATFALLSAALGGLALIRKRRVR